MACALRSVKHANCRPARAILLWLGLAGVSPMLRQTCARIIALAAMVAGPTAQAERGTLTLTCTGTAAQVDLQQLEANPTQNWKPITKPEPVSGGLTVDFTTGEVAFAGL